MEHSKHKKSRVKLPFSSQQKLVGGIPTPLKNMKISWGYELPNMIGKS
jgi:hypothetical protein